MLEQIKEHLTNEIAEIVEEGGRTPNQAAIETCLQIVEKMQPYLSEPTVVSIAAFITESSNIELVLKVNHSSLKAPFSGRSLTFWIYSDERTPIIFLLNEGGVQTTEYGLTFKVEELAKWLINDKQTSD